MWRKCCSGYISTKKTCDFFPNISRSANTQLRLVKAILSIWIRVGSCFATVRFTTIHFYDHCRVGPSAPDLWCITVPTQGFLSLLSAFPAIFRCACVSSFFYFSAVLLSWLWFFQPWRPSSRQKRRKNQIVDVTFFLDVFWNAAWAFFNEIKSDLINIFFSIFCVIFYMPNTLN